MFLELKYNDRLLKCVKWFGWKKKKINIQIIDDTYETIVCTSETKILTNISMN